MKDPKKRRDCRVEIKTTGFHEINIRNKFNRCLFPIPYSLFPIPLKPNFNRNGIASSVTNISEKPPKMKLVR